MIIASMVGDMRSTFGTVVLLVIGVALAGCATHSGWIDGTTGRQMTDDEVTNRISQQYAQCQGGDTSACEKYHRNQMQWDEEMAERRAAAARAATLYAIGAQMAAPPQPGPVQYESPVQPPIHCTTVYLGSVAQTNCR